jgi:hypothetical protein
MKSTSKKLFQPIFSYKHQPIKLFNVNQDAIGFNEINKMITDRMKRDADLLMSVSDSNSHI